MEFTYFTEEALKFLFENRMRNSKDWYESHKWEYKQLVYNPFAQLITYLAPKMTEIDSKIITNPTKLISRVRRDTRFSKDKTLYRDNVWLVFLRDKSQMSTSPCFWFELGQKGTSYGVGYYGAATGSMVKMRELIINNHPLFLEALECYESQNTFSIEGETYKRSKFPNKPENIRTWLDRKNTYFQCSHNDFSLAFSKELPDVLIEGFLLLKPIYDFLLFVES